MIEQLKNCPNCGGILNESGRCEFCGSKVYDFLALDFTDRRRPSAKAYIRIRAEGRVIIAPIEVSQVSLTSRPVYGTINGYGFEPSLRAIESTETEMNIECRIIGDGYIIQEEEEHHEQASG